MTSLYQAMLSQAVMGQLPSLRIVSQFSAAEIRQTLADLVAADRIDLANALADAGQSLYPDSEDILAISALLAEIQQNWTLAEDILRKLVDAQGAATTPFTWRHLIRVLRCQCDHSLSLKHTCTDSVIIDRLVKLLNTQYMTSRERLLCPSAISCFLFPAQRSREGRRL